MLTIAIAQLNPTAGDFDGNVAFMQRMQPALEKLPRTSTRWTALLTDIDNEYKRRQAASIIRVRSRAFGSGRQLPIAAHYPTGDDA